MSKKVVPIKYTSRDYQSIRNDLINHAKRYYPDSFRDFNEASFGSLMVDTVAYVGDILSFYLDYQVNESFLDSAIEYKNVLRLGRQMGYKFKGAGAATGMMTFYLLVSSRDAAEGIGPDLNYLPILEKGSVFGSADGNSYILIEDVNFNPTSQDLEIVAAAEDGGGKTTSWAIRAHGQVMAGQLVTDNITVGAFRRFFKTPVAGRNIIEILSVTDAEGHEYYEVEHLSQNTIYIPVTNKGTDRDTVKQIMKPVIVPRRFVIQKEKNITFLQFGYGSEANLKSNLIADPGNASLELHGKTYVSDTSFDPFKLTKTSKFGVGPADTTLTVRYLITNGANSNASVGSVTKVVTPYFSFPKELEGITLNVSKKQNVRSSLEAINEDQIIGSVSIPSSEELKVRIFDHFATQKRAVTRQDYVSMIYNMPPKFGSIKRAAIYQDQDSFKRNLNLYIISEDSTGNLITTNSTIKNNLKTWIRSYRMINDTIDILDAKIINFGVEFTAITAKDANKIGILDTVTRLLKENFASVKMEIGEPLYVSDIYKIINLIPGVIDTIDIKIVEKVGGSYSDVDINLKSLLSADGRTITVPDNVILELKFPTRDIKGILK
jgi:hypothetical protein